MVKLVAFRFVQALEKQIAAFASDDGLREAWIILIGHGTFYRDVAKFNLRGPDVSAGELKEWVGAIECPVIVVNCASSSGPFINRLSGRGRAVITATKSGTEQNFARFGDYLSQAIGDIAADLDHDDEVSLLEAFLSASGGVERFYDSENRLATEHALIDDNGDGLGTSGKFFRGVRATSAAKKGAAVDGRTSLRIGLYRSDEAIELPPEQVERRRQLESQIERLRAQKTDLVEEDYFVLLEELLVEIGRIYEQAETAHSAVEADSQPQPNATDEAADL